MIRGLRGEANLRTKNFQAIGVGVPASYPPELCDGIKHQIERLFALNVYMEDRDVLAAEGTAWLRDIADMAGSDARPEGWDLRVVFGAAKLAVDNTLPK